MQYKTITLGLLEQRPIHYEELRSQGVLLETMERLARQFHARHQELQATYLSAHLKLYASKFVEWDRATSDKP